MVPVYDVVKIAGISQMYDSIQADLTSQLRYLALWNESTATKTAMSYHESYAYQSTVIGVRPCGGAEVEYEIAPR